MVRDKIETSRYLTTRNFGSLDNTQIKKMLFPDKINFPYRLVLDTVLPAVFIKDKNFKLEFLIVSSLTGAHTVDLDGHTLKLSARSLDKREDKELKNRDGQLILKGKLETSVESGRVSFSKIRWNDVTSRYREGELVLVVEAMPH